MEYRRLLAIDICLDFGSVKRSVNRWPYVTISWECGGVRKPKPIVDNKEVPLKRDGFYGTKKCDCLFKLKREQSTNGQH